VAQGWVYFMTNRPNGILYTGVTDDLVLRAAPIILVDGRAKPDHER
jgi:hypothetical protein